eukprot:g10502.t1
MSGNAAQRKKLGFSMSAMPARVSFDQHLDVYVASYISASERRPELIPVDHAHRLRFCPPSARMRLRSAGLAALGHRSPTSTWSSRSLSSSPTATQQGSPQVPRIRWDCYPYQVLEGLRGLEVGQPVELQWKMQLASPFGWWNLGFTFRKSAWACVIFKHFSPWSRWYRLRVHVGQKMVKRCEFGGFTGGLRPISPEEERQWMHFFPQKLLNV